MRFVFNDPYAVRNAVEKLAGQQPIDDAVLETSRCKLGPR
jgi:hypothetical protein